MRKVFFAGTHRVRAPEATYASIAPLLGDYGITRLADVTGLDTLGIPVVMAVRPMAVTLTVSQGKGVSLLLAKISAAMESIEIWHAENAAPSPGVVDTPARELSLLYPFAALDWSDGNLITEHTRLDWIEALTLPDGLLTLVPRTQVQMGPTAAWHTPGLATSSNGLASGNTVAEATLHALYEVIERDATSALANRSVSQRRYIDPGSVTDAHCAELIERITKAGAWLELEHAPGRFGVPCMVAHLWLEDTSTSIAGGFGAHSDAGVALSRAITEAAQSRLTGIVGTRDDITAASYLSGQFQRPVTPGSLARWDSVVAEFADPSIPSFATDTAEVDWLARRVKDVTGGSPLRVVLAERDEFAVVKVICPYTHRAQHHHVRPAVGAESEAT